MEKHPRIKKIYKLKLLTNKQLLSIRGGNNRQGANSSVEKDQIFFVFDMQETIGIVVVGPFV